MTSESFRHLKENSRDEPELCASLTKHNLNLNGDVNVVFVPLNDYLILTSDKDEVLILVQLV